MTLKNELTTQLLPREVPRWTHEPLSPLAEESGDSGAKTEPVRPRSKTHGSINFLADRPITRKQRQFSMLPVPGNTAILGDLSYNFETVCASCGDWLVGSQDQRTRLCRKCSARKAACENCHNLLPVHQVQQGSKLCPECYKAVEKNCRICARELSSQETNWRTGMCDGCYDTCEKVCVLCKTELDSKELRYLTGLCNPCYDTCHKECKVCNEPIKVDALKWNSGLCDDCHATHETRCKNCDVQLRAEELHWCRKTGLCNSCYDKCAKICAHCQGQIPSGSLHYFSALCDPCYERCAKDCTSCKMMIQLGSLYYGTKLCDGCYEKCTKNCTSCKSRIDLGSLHYGTGLCDTCYDIERPRKLSIGVKATIASQLVFYMAPNLLQPSLFLQIKALDYSPHPTTVFAAVLTSASILSMVAPVPLAFWAERRGEREAYYGVSLAAAVAALLMVFRPPVLVFMLSWAFLNMPPAIRGVRALYFAKHVPPSELSRASQLATAAGLTGGFLGPLVSTVFEELFGNGSGSWFSGFTAGAALAALLCTACAAGFMVHMPPRSHRANTKGTLEGGRDSVDEMCERCGNDLKEDEKDHRTALCNLCWDDYETVVGIKFTFKGYQRRMLVAFCFVAGLLEVSMNAGVIATFQPIAVSQFHWGNNAIATVNFAGAGLSCVISFGMARLGLPERLQTAGAAALYLFGVLLFTIPPLSEWRLVAGLMLGIKAQILFMAPFTSIFSRLIGKARITSFLTTALCLAPAIGAAIGTVLAPVALDWAGTMSFTLVSVPAAVSVVAIALGWYHMTPFEDRGVRLASPPPSGR